MYCYNLSRPPRLPPPRTRVFPAEALVCITLQSRPAGLSPPAAREPNPPPAARSQEVRHRAPGRHHRRVLRRLREVLHRSLHLIVERQYARHVPAPVAVVGRGPDGYERLVREHVLQTLLHELVRAADELQAVDL